MNKFLKATLEQTISTNTIVRNASAGTDTYTIKNRAGKTLITIINGWDYGRYIVMVDNKTIADVEYYINAKNLPTQAQQDVLDLINLTVSAFQIQAQVQQEAKTLNPADRAIFDFLQIHR